MLKIKDDINLKELEKFGFEYVEEDDEDININDDLSEKNFIESILEILDKGE